jgi:hypothetical protein
LEELRKPFAVKPPPRSKIKYDYNKPKKVWYNHITTFNFDNYRVPTQELDELEEEYYNLIK